jgi:transcriptional antiterminator RfaH
MMMWYVVRTKAGREVTASVSVAEKGYQTFLPVQFVQRTHARKVEQLSRPLFPRYLFVRFDPSDDTHGDINTCRGVVSRGLIVNIKDKPISVPDAVIGAIRDRERVMRAVAGEIKTGYQPGETFTVAVGRFASMPATYMGEEKGKVMAIVEFMGKGHIQAFDFGDVPRAQNTLDGFAA